MKGFAKGVGKGLVGVVVRPTVGVLDLTTKTIQGNQFPNIIYGIYQSFHLPFHSLSLSLNISTLGVSKQVSAKEPKRVRLPRYFGSDKILSPFNPEKAFVRFLLAKVNDGKYIEEDIPHYLILKTTKITGTASSTKSKNTNSGLSGSNSNEKEGEKESKKKSVVIVTDQRVLYVRESTLISRIPSLKWQVPYKSKLFLYPILSISIQRNAIQSNKLFLFLCIPFSHQKLLLSNAISNLPTMK